MKAIKIIRELRGESGQAMVIMALFSGFVAMGFLALAVDMGMLYRQKQVVQTAADAGALAAAAGESAGGNITTLAGAAVTQNGLTVASTATTGKVQVTAVDGIAGAANVNYVQVTVTAQTPTYFMGWFGSSFNPVSVTSRAMASYNVSAAGNGPCLLTTATSGTSLTLNSGVGIKDAAGSNCGITVNSSATNAVSANVCNTTIVGSFNVVGGVQENCTNWGANSTPKTGATAAVDPFKSLAVPAKGTTQASNNLSIGGATTLSPGYYSGGINFNSPNSGTYTVTLSPGVYYIDGGININSGVTVTGTGVTIYLASGSFNVNSGATLKLTAPSTGSTADMIIWQAKSDTSGMNLDSTSSDSWGGAVYVPGATLTLNSDSNAVAYGMVVANTVMLNSVITLSCGSMPGGSCPGGSGASGPVAGGVSLVL